MEGKINEWEVMPIRHCTKEGEECLRVAGDNRDSVEFALVFDIEKISSIEKGKKFCSYTRLGKLTLNGYIPDKEAIDRGEPLSRLVQSSNGNLIMLIKRQKQQGGSNSSQA